MQWSETMTEFNDMCIESAGFTQLWIAEKVKMQTN